MYPCSRTFTHSSFKNKIVPVLSLVSRSVFTTCELNSWRTQRRQVYRHSTRTSHARFVDSLGFERKMLLDYLKATKERYLSDVRDGKGADWVVVMGNEAGGMFFHFIFFRIVQLPWLIFILIFILNIVFRLGFSCFIYCLCVVHVQLFRKCKRENRRTHSNTS